jgi:hypothetical protein
MTDRLNQPSLQSYLKVLQILCAGLKDLPEPWAVTGSLGFLLQGSDVQVHDIDLQTNRDGALAIESRFITNSIQPVVFSQADRIRSFLGALEIDGIRVELMGDLQKRMPDGTWEEPVDVRQYRRWVEADGYQIPVLDLEYEYLAYRILGRIEKAQVLREWLDSHPKPSNP